MPESGINASPGVVGSGQQAPGVIEAAKPANTTANDWKTGLIIAGKSAIEAGLVAASVASYGTLTPATTVGIIGTAASIGSDIVQNRVADSEANAAAAVNENNVNMANAGTTPGGPQAGAAAVSDERAKTDIGSGDDAAQDFLSLITRMNAWPVGVTDTRKKRYA